MTKSGTTEPQTGISYASLIVEALTRHGGSTAFGPGEHCEASAHAGTGRGGGGPAGAGRRGRAPDADPRAGGRGRHHLAAVHRRHHRPAEGRDDLAPGDGPGGAVAERVVAAAAGP